MSIWSYFFRTYANLTDIDLMLMDFEGGEYHVTPFFYKNGPIEDAGITVCQMNIEYHIAVREQIDTMATFSRLMGNILTSDYLPIIVVLYPEVNLYTLLANYKNPMCVEKYMKPLCL